MANVIGTDGLTPIYDPDIPHRLWFKNDIWLGENAAGKYVAKVDDLVYEITGGGLILYKVISVNEIDLTPVLEEVSVSVDKGEFSISDILFGVKSGTQADTYRVYLDKSTTPYTLCVDQRLQVNGTMSKYAKLFKGAVLTDKGEVVSKVYDNSGNLVSENILLETVAINNHDVYAIKSIPPCKCTHDLVDGEIVTAVLYSDDGGVVSKRQLLVEETGFIRGVPASTKYVSHIALETNFIKQGNAHVIEYPVNLPLNNINLIGAVYYSDGSVKRYPVDGTKFKLAGMNEFVATIVGQKIELVLIYMLDPNEVAYGTTSTDEKCITEPYELEVVDQDLDLSVKIFAYPEWIDEYNGYRLNFYLHTQDRKLWYDVTDLVQFDDRTDALDGTLYGYRQQKTIYLNMKDVSPTYKEYIHVQNIDLVLLRKPDGNKPLWRIKSVSNENYPYYEGIFAKISKNSDGQYFVNFSNDKENKTRWLESIYDVNRPMIDSVYETDYPIPNYFYLTINNATTKCCIDCDWNKDIPIPDKPSLYKNAKLRFTREMGDTILYLMTVDIPIIENS